MSTLPSLLVAISSPDLLAKTPYGNSSHEWLITLGAIGLVTLLATGCVVLFRKRKSGHHHRHHHHHHHHRHHHHDEPAESATSLDTQGTPEESGSGNHEHRRRRRRRREHRPRNPTLAETGGLPPIRTEESPGSPP